MRLHQFLNTYSAGRVLDVATGRGGFAGEFIQHVKEFDELVGIDSVDRNAEAFARAFESQPRVSFGCMDAARLDFPDASFDTVCMAYSLHHMAEPAPKVSSSTAKTPRRRGLSSRSPARPKRCFPPRC